jgi:serine phosphatase RsbU (regulator of sigma subunit)
MRSFFRKSVETQTLREPAPAISHSLARSDLAAVYHGARVGGDFFESLQAGHDRLIFVLLDIAGRHDEARDIAAAVQDALRTLVPQMFAPSDLNETDAVTELVLQLNNTILQAAKGVRCSPGFVACYNETLGMLSYINAGHIPALVRDDGSVKTLEASGLPLGLFSHATHECQFCVLSDGTAVLLASKGLIELRAHGEEFGLDRLKNAFLQVKTSTAREACAGILKEVDRFFEERRPRGLFRIVNFYPKSEGESLRADDITAVALVRAAARANAAAT